MSPRHKSVTIRPVTRTVKRLAKSAAWAALGVTERLPDDRAVLLSFDDGPLPGVTEPILERLARFGARAVFFSVGLQVERTGILLQVVHRAGHRIGNHSHEHLVEMPVRGGEIVLLHEKNEYVFYLLDRLLPGLADKGLHLGRGADQL